MPPASQMLVSSPKMDATTERKEVHLAIQDKRRNARVHHFSLPEKLAGWLLSWD